MDLLTDALAVGGVRGTVGARIEAGGTLDAIARSVGYTSVYAFSRAFRRSRCQAPGQFRTAARTSE